MTKKKSAKRAFISSFMSFIMCFAMLAGTTFAWYTDSVTSSGNKIIAGTLDIELWKYEPTNANAVEGYVDISTSAAPIFKSSNYATNSTETLWEPGKTQIAYLKIKNAGNLYLKYQVALEVYNVSKDLYKAMKYEIVPNAKNGELDTLSWTTLGGLEPVSIAGVEIPDNGSYTFGTTSVNVPMAPGDEHYFALAIHMDEEAGNEYMNGEVDFDLKVLATQQTEESDSFNNQYDAQSVYPEIVSGSAVYSTTEPTTVTAGNTEKVGTAKVTIPAGSATANNTALADGEGINLYVEETDTPANFEVQTGNSTTTYEVGLETDSGAKIVSNGTAFIVDLNIGVVDLQQFAHNGVAMESVDDVANLANNKYYYDVESGVVTFMTTSFSPFTSEYRYSGGLGDEDYPYLISDIKDFHAMASDYVYDEGWEQSLNDYCYKMTNDVTIENWCMNVVYVMKGAAAHDSYSSVFFGVFDGDNHTIHFNWNDDSAMPETSAISLFGEICNGTVKNLKVDCDIDSDLDVGVLSSYTYYGAQFDNVTVSGTIRTSAGGGNIGGFTLATWESTSSYHSLFKDCTVSADIYWKPTDKSTGYLYIAPYIAQLVGGSYLYFDNCVSSGSLNIPYNSTVNDIYTGTLYGRNPGYANVPEANLTNMNGKVGDDAFAAINNIYEGYTIKKDR
ncbi:MAG: hypothetical protein IJU94_05510 [Clostridia bacterium]|nr:hypothetical protein [Clostridia bacterium]